MQKYMLLLAVISLIAVSLHAGTLATVGTASIRAPAVILENNTGSLTNITLTITTGNGTVSITGPQTVGSSTNQSAYTAAVYASNYTNRNFSHYNFDYGINDADNVSGPSAGAAMTILTVSAFESRPLRNGFTMTGTISSNGSIGEIGGVYDKVAAAKNAGMELVLVPAVQQGSAEAELYYLVQTNFQIPLVQVANIQQAAYFALGNNNGAQNMTQYTFYTNYNISKITPATLNCSASCNETIFNSLLNETFNLTRNEINNLGTNPRFANVSYQLGRVLNQSIGIADLGYRYTGADFAFLDYVNAFYFDGYPSNRTDALAMLNDIKSFCTSLSPPEITYSNYDYVVNAEMRQYWGNYTISAALNAYNSSSIESDEILDELYLGAQSNAWCTATNLIYSEASAQNGTYLVPSTSLSSIATARINRALPYGTNLYLATAEQAYKQNNYPVTILDADYAYAFSNASSKSTLSPQQLDTLATSIAQNSTYGVWATEFSKESEFYVKESELAGNATLAKSYSENAYATALLAEQISNDTKVIRQNLVAQQTTQIQGTQINAMLNRITYYQNLIFLLLVLMFVLLITNTILIIILFKRQKPSSQKERVIKRKVRTKRKAKK